MIKSFSNTDCECGECQDKKDSQNILPCKTQKTVKTIRVADKDGNPVQDAHVWNIDKNFGTITDQQGIASISGDINDQIAITHVSFDTEQAELKDLQSNIALQTQNLDEVTIFADQPKQAGLGIGLAVIGLGFLLLTRKNKKPSLKGSTQKKSNAVEVTI